MSLVESERLILRPPRHADIQAMGGGRLDTSAIIKRLPRKGVHKNAK